MTPEVFDTPAVAAMLCCAESTVEAHARAGNLPGLKFGDRWVFPAAAFLARINELATDEAERRRSTGGGTTRPKSKRGPPALPTL